MALIADHSIPDVTKEKAGIVFRPQWYAVLALCRRGAKPGTLRHTTSYP